MKLQSLLSYVLTENTGGLSEDVLEIANYPEGFDINQFKDLTSFAAKARYLRSHGLDKLGAGSSRAAFIADTDFIAELVEIVVNHNLSMGDIDRISSWGIVNRNGSPNLVLVDYGLDDQVWKQHYARR